MEDVENFEKNFAFPEVEEPLYRIRTKLSIAEFSDVNKPLRVGLRYLHRAWSAAVDGYPLEAQKCRERGMSEVKKAKALLEKYLAEQR